MEHLNFNQQLAVKTVKGRVLILAGAGSGKTRVLVHRIAHLIKVHNVSPSSILGLTFTNKAADEMRERVKKLVYSELANQVILSTFHSFCMKVLKKNIHKLGFTSRFTLYDERDMRRLIAQIAEETYTGDTLSVDPIIKTIFYIKANGLDSEEFPTTSDTKYNYDYGISVGMFTHNHVEPRAIKNILHYIVDDGVFIFTVRDSYCKDKDFSNYIASLKQENIIKDFEIHDSMKYIDNEDCYIYILYK